MCQRGASRGGGGGVWEGVFQRFVWGQPHHLHFRAINLVFVRFANRLGGGVEEGVHVEEQCTLIEIRSIKSRGHFHAQQIYLNAPDGKAGQKY